MRRYFHHFHLVLLKYHLNLVAEDGTTTTTTKPIAGGALTGTAENTQEGDVKIQDALSQDWRGV